MAIPALEIQPINPLRFVPVEGELPQDPRTNLVHFDSDWFVNYIKDWQAKATYIQKWQFNDKIAFQCFANTTEGATIKLIDCYGRVLDTWSGTLYGIGGVSISKGGYSVAAQTYDFRWRFMDTPGLPEGIYWLYLTVGYDLNSDTVPETFRHCVTEPISIATKHIGTTHLDYYNSKNTRSAIFVQTNTKFSIRLAADLVEYTPVSVDTQYEDGGGNARMLASRAFRTVKYVLTERVPEWMAEKVALAWCCDNTSVDGVKHTKDIGAKFEINRLARVPKVIASLMLREAEIGQGAVQLTAADVEMYTLPAYPFAVGQLSLTDAAGTYEFVNPDSPYVIRSAPEHAAFLVAINAIAANDYYLSGAFSNTSGIVSFVSAGDDLILSGGVVIYHTPLSFEVTAAVASAMSFYNGDIIIDWGDSTVERMTTPGSATSTAHTYSGSATYDISIFGYAQVYALSDPAMENFSGKTPAGLTQFIATGSTAFASLDLAVFSLSLTSLVLINLSGNGLTTLTNTTVLSQMYSLTFASFAGNILSSASISDIIIRIDDMLVFAGFPLNGSLYVAAQTPPAPPTGPGAAAESDLETSYGWDVNTD